MVKTASRPREPRVVEAQYLRAVREIWRVAQRAVAAAIEPLFWRWPEQEQAQTDAKLPGVTIPRPHSAWSLSDAELRRLWPGLDPADVRAWAPWASSRAEVARIVARSPRETDLEEIVARAIREARLSAPPDDTRLTRPADPPGEDHFPVKYRGEPVVVGASGIPLPGAIRPDRVTRETIRRQIDWLDLRLGEIIHEARVSEVVTPIGVKVEQWTTRDLERVLGIDLRENPAVAKDLDDWTRINVDLIESGIRGEHETVRLRSMLEDVEQTLTEGFDHGLRVEYIAGDLVKRFGVSDSRAELIARDQTLKLHGQINRSRQKQAGVTRYQWSTSHDERVRETHQALDGTIQSWAAPPQVSDDGRHEHPGGDYQCRCIAIPVLDEISS